MLLPSLQTTQATSSSYQNDSSLPPGHCRRWDISHEQLLWTFMLANYAKWYSFTPPQLPNFPPPLTPIHAQLEFTRIGMPGRLRE